MSQTLIVVDVQRCFVNDFTAHIPARIATLIERDPWDEVLYTRFVNVEDSPFRRFLGWEACDGPPGTELADEIAGNASDDMVYSKPGYAGLPDTLADHLLAKGLDSVHVVGFDTDMCVLKVAMDLFDLGIEPIVLTDCCASTAGLQAHLAGLAVLARNIGAGQLHDAGLGRGSLAAPISPLDQN